jgi:calcium-binding protein CML
VENQWPRGVILVALLEIVREGGRVSFVGDFVSLGAMCFEGGASSSNSNRGNRLRVETTTTTNLSKLQQDSGTWQTSQLREAFDFLDRDGDGTIRAEDLASFLQQSLAKSPEESSSLTFEDVERMISIADRDGDGAVGFEEFVTLVHSHIPPRPESFSALGEEALKEMFRVLDRNGDGVLCSDDLGGVMGIMGQLLTPEDLRAMLDTATGRSGRSEVTFEDFRHLMSSTVIVQ